MPTPFYHLYLAQDLINHPCLPGSTKQFLQDHRREFLFGSTAPDVQVISGQARQDTHFFNLPIQDGDQPAWEIILIENPQLATAGQLRGSQAAFLAGYMCHLQADWLWVKDIFAPVFGPHRTWGTFAQRLYYHNVLRAYLDLTILPELSSDMATCLGTVKPDCWLPFVEDCYLTEWRDLLAPQLKPGAAIQTVKVFSDRQGVPAPEYDALLSSDERMQQEIFSHLPPETVQTFWKRVTGENIHLLSDYLAFTLHPIHSVAEEC